jgi:hypothetical protein
MELTKNLEVRRVTVVNVQVRNDGRSSVERLDTSETGLNREGNSRNGDISGVGSSDNCEGALLFVSHRITRAGREWLHTASSAVKVESNVRRVGNSIEEVLVSPVVERLEGLIIPRKNECSLRGRIPAQIGLSSGEKPSMTHIVSG